MQRSSIWKMLKIFPIFSKVKFKVFKTNKVGNLADVDGNHFALKQKSSFFRTNSKPNELAADTVIAAMPPHRYITLTRTNTTKITASTNRGRVRSVEFTTNTCGDVCMTSLTGFTAFSLQPLPKQDCKEPAPSVVVSPCNFLAGL